jgi:hypothetical protein
MIVVNGLQPRGLLWFSFFEDTLQEKQQGNIEGSIG